MHWLTSNGMDAIVFLSAALGCQYHRTTVEYEKLVKHTESAQHQSTYGKVKYYLVVCVSKCKLVLTFLALERCRGHEVQHQAHERQESTNNNTSFSHVWPTKPFFKNHLQIFSFTLLAWVFALLWVLASSYFQFLLDQSSLPRLVECHSSQHSACHVW